MTAPSLEEGSLMRPALTLALGITCLGLSGTFAQSPSGADGSPKAAASPAGVQTGPRKRIAVLKVEASVAASQYGDVGAGMAAQLTTALINSGEFIVVERSELASVLREQELGVKNLAIADTAATAGKLLGVQYLVRATLTDFDQRSGGGGLRLGIGLPFGKSSLGTATNTGVVAVDVRLIDTTSGQVVLSRRVEQKTEDSATSADIGIKNVTFGGDGFEHTSLGKASAGAVQQIVDALVEGSRTLPWTGRVVEVADGQVYVNAGSETGMRPGHRFWVSTVVRELTDPATGAPIGREEQRVGEIEIVNVQKGFSTARMVSPFSTRRGDLVSTGGAP
jgi:curli biogenesis system outer membrane secretion channel CsgG